MSTEPLHTEDSDALSETPTRYRCPFCETEYTNELLTRVHITRSTNDVHQNHDGLMPETKVEALDADGNVIDQLQRRPDDIDTRSLEPNDLPAEFDERKQRVLLIAAYHPYTETDTELHERASAVLEERDLNSVSYTTTRRWVHEFYMPDENTADAEEAATDSADTPVKTETKSDESLQDLTLKQQAVVIQHVADPETSDGEIADRVGCSRSYPYHVYDRASELIERLTANRETGTSIEEFLRTELDAETIDNLRNEGYLSGLDIEDVSITNIEPRDEDAADSIAEETDGPTTTSAAHVMSATPTDALLSHSDIPRQEATEASTDNQQATPNETEDQPTQITPDESEAPRNGAGERTDASPETYQTSGSQNPDPVGMTTTSPSDGATADRHPSVTPQQDEVVSKGDLERVTERVQFLRRVFEREIETSEKPNDRAHTQLAITKEVEAELEQLLSA